MEVCSGFGLSPPSLSWRFYSTWLAGWKGKQVRKKIWILLSCRLVSIVIFSVLGSATYVLVVDQHQWPRVIKHSALLFWRQEKVLWGNCKPVHTAQFSEVGLLAPALHPPILHSPEPWQSIPQPLDARPRDLMAHPLEWATGNRIQCTFFTVHLAHKKCSLFPCTFDSPTTDCGLLPLHLLSLLCHRSSIIFFSMLIQRVISWSIAYGLLRTVLFFSDPRSLPVNPQSLHSPDFEKVREANVPPNMSMTLLP